MVNHHLVRTDRPRARGGGTAIAVHRDLDYRVIPIKDLAELCVLEATAILVSKQGGKKLFMISIYNCSERRRVTVELRRIFDLLALDRPEHDYIIGATLTLFIRTGGSTEPVREDGSCGILRNTRDHSSVSGYSLQCPLRGPRVGVIRTYSLSRTPWTSIRLGRC